MTGAGTARLGTIPVLKYNETHWLPIALEDMEAGTLVRLRPYGTEDYGAYVASLEITSSPAHGVLYESVKKGGLCKILAYNTDREGSRLIIVIHPGA